MARARLHAREASRFHDWFGVRLRDCRHASRFGQGGRADKSGDRFVVERNADVGWSANLVPTVRPRVEASRSAALSSSGIIGRFGLRRIRSLERNRCIADASSAFGVGSRSASTAFFRGRLRPAALPLFWRIPRRQFAFADVGLDQTQGRPDDPADSASSTGDAAITCGRFRRTNFREPIRRGRRARATGSWFKNRSMSCEKRSAIVPPLPLLRQGLHHDPVQVASHESAQSRRLDLPRGGDAGQRRPTC